MVPGGMHPGAVAHRVDQRSVGSWLPLEAADVAGFHLEVSR